ncbi:hypothetical protein RB601_001498 [Gaeumannomyces tritici]
MFAFDPSLLPSLRTRKALLILDLQNDFLSPDGALFVSEPEGYVQRTIAVANAFRQSGSGDVIWVRSEFEQDRTIVNNQILTSDLPIPTTVSARGRRAGLGTGKGEADHEAFLSLAGDPESPEADDDGDELGPKPECVRPGKDGSALADHVAAAVAAGKDSVLTKTQYSAFQSGQLLKLLRTRFATELFICGALTNVSIHATALDGASHGLRMTIVEDCCGYRSLIRHNNAIRNLVQLTGCETATAEDLITSLGGSPSPATAKGPAPASIPIREKKEAGRGPSTAGPVRTSSGSRSSPKDKFVRDTIADSTTDSSSSPAALKGDLKTLSDASPAAAEPNAPQPQARQQPLQAMVGSGNPDLGQPVGLPKAPPALASKPKAVPSLGSTSTASDSLQHADDSPGQKKTPDSSDSSPRALVLSTGANDKLSLETKPAPDTSAPASHVVGDSHAVGDDTIKSSKTLSPEINTAQDSEEDARVPKMKEGSRPAPSEPLCEGDTTIFHNVLSEKLESGIFERLRDEVRWLRMSHQGGEVPRLVCVQGEVDAEGNMPVYRHPSDESPPLVPFSPTVLEIKREIEEVLGHTLNHVLIQFYRSGSDYISEHSDKTLDIVPGSFIANVSLGAERTMVLRTKRADKDPSRKSGSPETSADQQQQDGPAKREVVRARLPHNSLCRMGLKTNECWLHAIRQDKRMDRDKTDGELAFSGGRISLTFRKIGTFLNRDSTAIWGQGATSKAREGAGPVVNGQGDEAIRMLKAFGTENHSSSFDWAAAYGAGFDVLHMSSSPRFFSGPDPVVNMRVQLMLAAFGVSYARGSVGPAPAGATDAGPADAGGAVVKFIDNDPGKASLQGDVAVMLYLDNVHRPKKGAGGAPVRPELARELTRFQQALGLLDRWRAVAVSTKGEVAAETKQLPGADGVAVETKGQPVADEPAAAAAPSLTKKATQILRPLARDLAVYDAYATEAAAPAPADGTPDKNSDAGGYCFIAGGASASIADYALWPVLHDMASSCGGPEAFAGALRHLKLGRLAGYYESFGKTDCVRRVLDGDAGKPAAQSSCLV